MISPSRVKISFQYVMNIKTINDIVLHFICTKSMNPGKCLHYGTSQSLLETFQVLNRHSWLMPTTLFSTAVNKGSFTEELKWVQKQPQCPSPILRTTRRKAGSKPHWFSQNLCKQGWMKLVYVSENHNQGKKKVSTNS